MYEPMPPDDNKTLTPLMQKRVLGFLRARRRIRWTGPLTVVMVLVAHMTVRLFTDPGHRWVRLADYSVIIPVCIGVMWVISAFAARFDAQRTNAELARLGTFAFYRRTLERGIRVSRVTRWAALLAAVVASVMAYRSNDLEITIALTVISVLAAGAAVHSQWVLLPRLRRWYQELA